MTLTEFLLARIAEDEKCAKWAGGLESGGETLLTWYRDLWNDEVVVQPALPNAGEALRSIGVDIDPDDSDRMSRPHGPYIPEGGGHVADHVARHDPARVLAECEAKRAIVDLHSHSTPRWREDDGSWPHHGFWVGGTCHQCDPEQRGGPKDSVPAPAPTEWCETVRHLAAIYADHPDYDEAWRP